MDWKRKLLGERTNNLQMSCAVHGVFGGLRVDRHAVHVSVITCEMAVRALRERRGLRGIQLCCLDKWRRER